MHTPLRISLEDVACRVMTYSHTHTFEKQKDKDIYIAVHQLMRGEARVEKVGRERERLSSDMVYLVGASVGVLLKTFFLAQWVLEGVSIHECISQSRSAPENSNRFESIGSSNFCASLIIIVAHSTRTIYSTRVLQAGTVRVCWNLNSETQQKHKTTPNIYIDSRSYY